MPKPCRPLPELRVLRERFRADFDAGKLYNKDGTVAGWDRGHGYLTVQVAGQQCLVHRIMWFMATGEEPECLDHIDRNRQNNSIENLRPVTLQENSLNRTVQSSVRSGVLGVGWNNSGNKWTATIYRKGKYTYLGRFTELADAIAARKAAELVY